MANPLKQFARIPKIYMKLPTAGKFYSTDFIHTTNNGEIGIKAMTATDELYMTNPDALLNGDAIIQILKSCVTGVADVNKLKLPDVNAILLAIRGASRGDKITFTAPCPHCGKDHEEKLSIRSLLDAMVILNSDNTTEVKLETDGGELIVNIQSSPYSAIAKANVMGFELARLRQYMETNTDITNEERKKAMEDAFKKMAAFQKDVFITAIDSVDLVDTSSGERIITKVSDKEHIEEFFDELEGENSKRINKYIEELNSNIGVPDRVTAQCTNSECGKQFEMEVKFDPANFFVENF